MRSRLSTILFAFALVALLVPASAPAAKRSAKAAPKITSVTPMRVTIGTNMTIRGTGFSSRRTRNTVIFRAPNGRTAFVKPRAARRGRLSIRVPSAVTRLLSLKSGRPVPTRFKLRVLSGRFGSYTAKRLSPVVVPLGFGGIGGPGSPGGSAAACGSGDDWDGDLLSNGLELGIGTDPCLADTDRDSMSDGWEYWAARDLNLSAVPFPATRPYPNALDSRDGDGGNAGFSPYDFDGDGLTTSEEYRAWRFTGSSFNPASGGSDSTLGYSDGTKSSRAGETPAAPAWRSAQYGLTPPSQPFPATFNMNGDGQYTDNERDADGDGLANYIEAARGPGLTKWWKSLWASVPVDPWPAAYYSDFSAQRPFTPLDLANSDVDGNSLLDGEDDQDFDDYNNVIEFYEALIDLDGNGSVLSIDRSGSDYFINAFNPCAPDENSRTCDFYQPF